MNRMEKECLKCKKVFKKPISCSKKDWKSRKYCSCSCANSVNSKGRPENFRKNPYLKKGHTYPELSGKNHPNYNRIIKNCLNCGIECEIIKSRETRFKYCSKKCMYSFLNKGISTKHELLRRSAKAKEWREQIFIRDNYTCQKTGKSGYLAVHHIINFAEDYDKMFDIDNGITLLYEEHLKFHKIYGFRNNTREQLDEFLTSLD